MRAGNSTSSRRADARRRWLFRRTVPASVYRFAATLTATAMKIDWVILITVMLALLAWEVLDRLFLGSALDSVLPSNYEVTV